MRICYYADGRYIHAERWMRYFSGRGHEMHLISFAEVSEERARQLREIGIKYHGSTGNFHVKRIWRTARDQRFLRSILKKEKIDVLHCHFLGANCWHAAISGFHPYIITIMGGDVVGSDWRPAGSLPEKLLTPLALKRADAITAWSPVLAERVKPFLRSAANIDVLHGGVDLDRFKPGGAADIRENLQIPDNGRIVFSPRLIRPLYNIETIALAAGHVCEKYPETYFLMALPETILDGEYVARVKSIFSSGAASERVRYLPTIEHNVIADYFRLADITVSIPDTDGTPMTVLESMACGTPTVIGNLPDYDPEYFEHEQTTLMVDVKDAESVAGAIVRLLSDNDSAARLAGEARRRVVATGSYEFQMSKMEEIYQRVTGR